MPKVARESLVARHRDFVDFQILTSTRYLTSADECNAINLGSDCTVSLSTC